MITPEIIESKEFKKGFRGYNEAEVDIFLDELRDDFEATLKENEALKEKLSMYKDQVGKYSSIEETLKETLITAQSAAEDTTNAANKKARVIVQEAELQSKQMIDKANNKVVEIRNEYESLVKEFKVFRNKFKSLLEDEMKNVDDIFNDVETDRENFNQVNSPVAYENSGTMRMSVLEDVQEEEDKTISMAAIDEEIVTAEDLKETGSPEDIFNIK
ncbi:Minicell-associated protein DivIVA [Peptostreptococcus anaerobius]|jgi:cell division initiation protein|uniref:Minicell-associated protein DivIVA n=2 Tax=Peptostreptococcus anaerobius TaxID=1261 RepID=A0A135YVZ2_9FIRM|nr:MULTISPECIES: DivIVA domain-containing protein [Peptostreptococcus]EKX95604.1 septum site-determining protein divIVA family protein [Peptostreptococcus anaerobius VPI 4330 = DSM 2949]KXI13511.1 septum site-determining protein divIVA family protein [Peptostreptococcus anaerobius]MDB8849379.1 DivIVA domain-containing protein [Peptostreptococcus anaerobius]MDB8853080.1 DivIVA domain-containing protein [Peptostreptococcus anaerobius]MDB8854986.1 DivIVA domain-containing protein [Peptostreptococ